VKKQTGCCHGRGRRRLRCCTSDAGPVNTILGRVLLRVGILSGQVIGAVVQPAGIIVHIEVDRYACWHAGTVRLA